MHHRSSAKNSDKRLQLVVFSGKDYSGGSLSVSVPQTTESTTGKKKFELSNHLGNVLAVIGDRKQKSQQSTQHQAPEVVNLTDYYPFGMVMPGRSYSADDYRYGFNGMEQDDEIKGSGNSYTAAFWEYDPRIGRRSNVDPITYSFHGGYTSFNNNPIYYIDELGLFSSKKDARQHRKENARKGRVRKSSNGNFWYRDKASGLGYSKANPNGNAQSKFGLGSDGVYVFSVTSAFEEREAKNAWVRLDGDYVFLRDHVAGSFGNDMKGAGHVSWIHKVSAYVEYTSEDEALMHISVSGESLNSHGATVKLSSELTITHDASGNSKKAYIKDHYLGIKEDQILPLGYIGTQKILLEREACNEISNSYTVEIRTYATVETFHGNQPVVMPSGLGFVSNAQQYAISAFQLSTVK